MIQQAVLAAAMLAGIRTATADKARQEDKTFSRELTDKVLKWLCAEHDDVMQDLTVDAIEDSRPEYGESSDHQEYAVALLAEQIEAFAGDYIEDRQPRGPLFVSVALDAIDWHSIADKYVADVI